jgi:hypothetical protein
MVTAATSFVVILFTLLIATITGQDTDVGPNVSHCAALCRDAQQYVLPRLYINTALCLSTFIGASRS